MQLRYQRFRGKRYRACGKGFPSFAVYGRGGYGRSYRTAAGKAPMWGHAGNIGQAVCQGSKSNNGDTCSGQI